MQIVTVGAKNQIVLPKEVRRKIKGLQPGKKVMIYRLNSDTIALKVESKNWIEATSGIAKDAWKNIDTAKYLDKLRDEWDE